MDGGSIPPGSTIEIDQRNPARASDHRIKPRAKRQEAILTIQAQTLSWLAEKGKVARNAYKGAVRSQIRKVQQQTPGGWHD